MNKVTQTTIIIAAALLMAAEPAWAYLDPGTGSLILQSLIAGIAGLLVVGRLYWAKLKSFLAAAFSQSGTEPAVEKPSDDERENKGSELP
ncbi:MAG: hypothetical protein KJO95_03260 [Gammaproteobacteria bacterium]|nr:hypothetical protein [Gammaproteobacteria bacterium]MBU2676257.1 hypothetical protein [Gammaproteobacteria bacterium]NNC56402.1 hypothetical protein [Woeseiaceae bacterium]NNL49992.1 hypothetical protein [Woeseiaceae bacterium]